MIARYCTRADTPALLTAPCSLTSCNALVGLLRTVFWSTEFQFGVMIAILWYPLPCSRAPCTSPNSCRALAATTAAADDALHNAIGVLPISKLCCPFSHRCRCERCRHSGCHIPNWPSCHKRRRRGTGKSWRKECAPSCPMCAATRSTTADSSSGWQVIMSHASLEHGCVRSCCVLVLGDDRCPCRMHVFWTQ